MASPKDLRYTKTHEWVRVDGDVATIGLSDHAQSELGDITYLELPDIGDEVTQSEPLGVVESVKAASDIYAPVSGTIAAVNSALADKPETINEDAFGEGWLFVIEASDPEQANDLLDPDAYAALVEDEG